MIWEKPLNLLGLTSRPIGPRLHSTFTEALPVRNRALRLRKWIERDSTNMKASNPAEAGELIHKRYRAGFGIGT